MSQTRRDFLKASLGGSTLLSLAPTVPMFLGRTAAAAPPRRDAGKTVLVMVQLSGGNDGLNTLVPFEDDVYARSRRTLRMLPKEVHKINAEQGFHPQAQAFQRLFKDGYLSVVQGVGYPNSDRGHSPAMRNWHTARPEKPNCPTGWLGRAVDYACRTGKADVPGVFVGPISLPFGLHTEKAVVPSIRSLEGCVMRTAPGPGGQAHRRLQTQTAELPRAEKDPLLDFLRQRTLAAYASSQRIEEVARKETSAGAAGYPSFQLAQTFKTVAIRIYFTEIGGGGIGGFDNHANQRGNHGALLRELAESTAAFVHDLKRDKLLDRVLLMTFSEFGRTVTENGRRGTGHGAAAPMFLAGGRLKGGLIGARPSLADLDNDAPKHHIDFRQVYATALDRWLGFDSEAILGRKYEPVGMLQG